MKVANFSLATLVAGALLIGTGVSAKDNLSFENVDYKYAVSKLGSGMRFDTKSTFIDARNATAYEKGTIPSAFNVESANFDSQIAIISKVPKENEVIVFCEDSACKEKFDVAQKLKDNGYKNVKIYKDGYAEW